MNVDLERGDIEPVMLSEAKHDKGCNPPVFSQRSSSRPRRPGVSARRTRSLASLRSCGMFLGRKGLTNVVIDIILVLLLRFESKNMVVVVPVLGVRVPMRTDRAEKAAADE